MDSVEKVLAELKKLSSHEIQKRRSHIQRIATDALRELEKYTREGKNERIGMQ